MKQRYDKDGYKRISLTKHTQENKIHETFFTHRLVAVNFLKNINNDECINHIDENKENNNASNLEWCSRKYNNSYGSRKSIKKTKAKKIIDISNNIIYKSMAEAGRSVGVTSGAIYNCVIGRNKTSCGHIFMYYDKYLTIQEAI